MPARVASQMAFRDRTRSMRPQGFHNPGNGLSKRSRRWGRKGLANLFQDPSPWPMHWPHVPSPIPRQGPELWSQVTAKSQDKGCHHTVPTQDWHFILTHGSSLTPPHPMQISHCPQTLLLRLPRALLFLTPLLPGLSFPSQSFHSSRPLWVPTFLRESPDLSLALKAPHTLTWPVLHLKSYSGHFLSNFKAPVYSHSHIC